MDEVVASLNTFFSIRVLGRPSVTIGYLVHTVIGKVDELIVCVETTRRVRLCGKSMNHENNKDDNDNDNDDDRKLLDPNKICEISLGSRDKKTGYFTVRLTVRGVTAPSLTVSKCENFDLFSPWNMILLCTKHISFH